MSARITTISEPSRTLIKIDGRLTRVEAGELARLCQELKEPAALDLTELQSVDRDCLAMLRGLINGGLELRAASPYVELLLKSEPRTNQ